MAGCTSYDDDSMGTGLLQVVDNSERVDCRDLACGSELCRLVRLARLCKRVAQRSADEGLTPVIGMIDIMRLSGMTPTTCNKHGIQIIDYVGCDDLIGGAGFWSVVGISESNWHARGRTCADCAV